MKNPTFTGKELAEATRGSWRDGRLPAEAVAVYTDTRVAGEGRLFLALPGEKFDAHDYLAQAVAAGAGGLCIRRDRAEKLPEPCPVPVLEVDDTLAAYQKIANFHRRRFPELKLVAVTGSVGKTSVKEIVRAILTAASSPEAVLYTEGNTNNQIGVPQNLLRLNSRHRYAVIEMGTNHHGEIEPLSRMAEPLASLVNSIAPCHLEFLGSLEGVAREKSHIFCGLPESGAAVIPADGPAVEVLETAAESYRVFRFGEDVSRCDVAARYLGGTLEGSRFELSFRTGERFTLEWALTGRHQARNAAAAAALAVAIGIPPETIAAGVVHARAAGNAFQSDPARRRHLCERRLQRQSGQHARGAGQSCRVRRSGPAGAGARRNARAWRQRSRRTPCAGGKRAADLSGSPAADRRPRFR